MADNYLEKRMEDYARNRSGVPSRHTGPRPGWLAMRYAPLVVYVRNADMYGGEAVVTMFVSAGCKVVFTASDRKRGTDLAQRLGGRFYPVDTNAMLADMQGRGEAIDVEIVCGELPHEPLAQKVVIISSEEQQRVIPAVQIVGSDVAQAARIALMVAHSSAAMPPQTIMV